MSVFIVNLVMVWVVMVGSMDVFFIVMWVIGVICFEFKVRIRLIIGFILRMCVGVCWIEFFI